MPYFYTERSPEMKYMYIIEKSLNHNLKETAEYASDDLAIENLIK